MIKWIIIVTIGLIVLGYLGFDIRKAIEAPTTKTNLEYAKEAVAHVWTKYLKAPAVYLWDKVFIKYVWEPAIEKLDKNIKEKNNSSEKNLKSATST